MKMTVRRSGGFMGLRPVEVEVPLDELSPAEHAAIARLVDAPFTGGEARAGAPDAYRYRITLAGGEQDRVVEVDETRVSPELRALLHRLTAN